MTTGATLQSIRYERGKLDILDQLQLPTHTEYVSIKNTNDGWDAIKQMKVRGAPGIAIAGCLSMAVELFYMEEFTSHKEIANYVQERLNYLVTARPTAVNMLEAARRISCMLTTLAANTNLSLSDFKEVAIEAAEILYEDDVIINKRCGQYGADDILTKTKDNNVNILTHCNTGSLASAGYGTALGVIRFLHEKGKLNHVYCTETRPYNQGSRLTAYELVHEKIPATLILDSTPAILMSLHNISAVVVGADRVTANGDTANKIGTLQIAIVAKYFNVPFYVACPFTSFDPNKKSGKEIVIEDRPHVEMTSIKGHQIAPSGINCWNPAFDVTPAELITGGIITEFGVFQPSELKEKLTAKKLESEVEEGSKRRRSAFASIKNGQ